MKLNLGKLIFCGLAIIGPLNAHAVDIDFCDRNVHVVTALEKATGKQCEQMHWVDINRLSKLEIDMHGEALTFLDLNFGWLISDLKVVNLGNSDVNGVFDAICDRVSPCKLSLSFMGQKVLFTHRREIDGPGDKNGFFNNLNLESLELNNLRFNIFRPAASETAIEYALISQKNLKHLSITQSDLNYIGFHSFDKNQELEELILSDNKYLKSIGFAATTLRNLKFIDISGVPNYKFDTPMTFNSTNSQIKIRACRMSGEFIRSELIKNFEPKDKFVYDFCDR